MLAIYTELSGEGSVLAQEESLSGNDISTAAPMLQEEEKSVPDNDISTAAPMLQEEEKSVPDNDVSAAAPVLPEEESLSGNDISAAAPVLPEEESLSDNDISAEVYAEVYAEEAEAPEADRRSQPEAMWQTNGGWVEGSLSEAVENVANGGTIVLLSDVSLTSGITISKSMRITSYDSSKPFTIKNMTQDTVKPQDSGRIFTITAGQVSLQDIILDGGKDEGVRAFHPLVCVVGQNAGQTGLGILRGTVLQNAENISQAFCGGGINIRSGQVYLGDGARITNCKARHGGGIEVNGKNSHGQATLEMVGGSIDGCKADAGAGVSVNIGMFRMAGGEITGNQAAEESTDDTHIGGGGIFLSGAESPQKMAAVFIEGGKITGNEARSNGGGILVLGGATQLRLTGGILEGNTARCGGGVAVIRGRLQLRGGTVTGNTAGLYGGGILGTPESIIELQGNPRVFENRAGVTQDRFDNLYLDGNVDDSGRETTVPIKLTGPLTDGVQLGLSLWVRPDADGHPYRDMIVSSDSYTIQQEDLDRLYNGGTDNKELHADNMEKYAFILYDGKFVMVPAVKVSLDRDSLVLENEGETASLTATVTPDHALIKDVTWTSSNPDVATVDENGKVTATGKGEAVITATTVAPYHDFEPCHVTVGIIPYQIVYHLEGGALKEGETNPDFYTIKSGEIILNAPVRSGYRFVGWEGTDLAEITPVVIIPSGSTGAREYRAVWEKEESPGDAGDHPDDDSGKGEEKTDGQTSLPENGEQSAEKSGGAESQTAQSLQTVQNAAPQITQNLNIAQNAAPRNAQSVQTTQNPRTGSHIFRLYAAAALSAFCMLLLTFMQIKKGKLKRKQCGKGRK